MLQKTNDSDASSAAGAKDKRANFVRIAENRTRNAIKAIRVIGKLGNKNAYDYSDADVKRITQALAREVDQLKARLSSTGGKEMVDFKL
jgi:ribosomal protein L7/L12